jgi:hypothetical protein
MFMKKLNFTPLLLALTIILLFQSVVFAEIPNTSFSDVDSNAWYAGAVTYCLQNGFMSGTSETTFEPNGELSRAMLVTILHRAAGTPGVIGLSAFNDVENGVWYSEAIAWASQNNIVSGQGNGLFGTNDPVTREQLITILWRYDGSNAFLNTPSFVDMESASSWAVPAISWGSENEIVNVRSENRFDPRSNVVRAEAAFMLYKYLTPNPTEPVEEKQENIIFLHIGEHALTVTLVENSSVTALRELLAEGDVTIDMRDYGGFEKVGNLGTNLPTNDVRITSEPGDLILYQGNSLVIFYAPNTWNYTRLGKINEITQDELRNILGSGNVTVTLSLTR